MYICVRKREIDHIITKIYGPPKGQTVEIRHTVVLKCHGAVREEKKKSQKTSWVRVIRRKRLRNIALITLNASFHQTQYFYTHVLFCT